MNRALLFGIAIGSLGQAVPIPIPEDPRSHVPRDVVKAVEAAAQPEKLYELQFTRLGIPFAVLPPAPCSCNLGTQYVCSEDLLAQPPQPPGPGTVEKCRPNAGCRPGFTQIQVQCAGAQRAAKLAQAIRRLELKIRTRNCLFRPSDVGDSGLALYGEDEGGTRSAEVIWTFSKTELRDSEKAVAQRTCEVLARAKEYVRAPQPGGSPKVEPFTPQSLHRASVIWKIPTGQHQGTFRGFSAHWVFEAGEWRQTSFGFPFGDTQ